MLGFIFGYLLGSGSNQPREVRHYHVNMTPLQYLEQEAIETRYNRRLSARERDRKLMELADRAKTFSYKAIEPQRDPYKLS